MKPGIQNPGLACSIPFHILDRSQGDEARAGCERKAGTHQPAKWSSSEQCVYVHVCVHLCRFLLWPRSLEGGPAPCKLRGKFQHRLLTEHHSGCREKVASASAACWGPGLKNREGQGAEDRRPGLDVCPAEGFTVLQQHPTAGSTSSGQERKGAREETMLGPPGRGNGSGMWGLRP